ncbi:MAG TPA: SoxXA-binding protein [Thioalkalivibrio sp.]|nr:SoxXA-binding protein [Thioalkalivibrio sp.]
MKIHSMMATVVLSAVLAAGCASTSNTQSSASEAEFTQAIAAAETSRQQAASVGGEWRDTGKLIEAARKAASEGKYDEALSLAEQARLEGMMGYEQAMGQQAAGPLF